MNLTVNNIDLFSLFISAGGLGFLTYNILAKTGKIYVRSNDQKDKYITLIFLSMLNYIVFLTVSLIVDYLNHAESNTKILLSIVITLFISVILPMSIPIKWFDKFNKMLNKQRNNMGYANNYSETTRERFFNVNQSKSIFIFDLQNNFIESGSYYNVNESYKDDFEIAIVPFDSETTLNNYDNLMEYIQNNQNVNAQTLINFDKQLKIIMFD
ncbi:hypothetical protein CW685_00345 [Macrococcoides caseolyticum]|uniref:hypothetical protein n=1 Tax=Macrococcoides caseolyticum TaxID=69966 RepID=UPI000C3448A7|nr:hypothetical protein [Macrococcus caseolyticus]PKE13210.1 hypothetical protein CW685_00345 [Macrococcus caseolyticus]